MPKSEDKQAPQLPVPAVVQIVRVTPLENNNFIFGTKLLKMPKEDLNAIIEQASKGQNT